LEKPGELTTSGRSNWDYHKCFNNKHLIPAKDGQFSPAWDGQGHWLFQQTTFNDYSGQCVQLLWSIVYNPERD